MEVLLRLMLLCSATTTVLVTADSSTSHYLGCLHESQCEKAFEGTYCCPTGTCCHFYVRDSSKFMSRCKRIRPGQTAFCQDRDKILLNDRDLQDKRFLTEYPPNKGVLCLRRPLQFQDAIFCFGGTDSEEEEFKTQGIQMTVYDGLKTIHNGDIQEVIRSELKNNDTGKLLSYVDFFTKKNLGPK